MPTQDKTKTFTFSATFCPAISGIDTKNSVGFTALHMAAMSGAFDPAKQLLERGANPKRRDTLGKSCALHFAALGDKCEIAKLLLDFGADINQQNGVKNTALHIAAENKKHKMLRFLLENRADIDIRNNENLTAFEILRNNNDNVGIKIFLEFRTQYNLGTPSAQGVITPQINNYVKGDEAKRE